MFKTSDFIFRSTVMGEALAKAGAVEYKSLVREPRIEVIDGARSHQIRPRLDQK